MTDSDDCDVLSTPSRTSAQTPVMRFRISATCPWDAAGNLPIQSMYLK